MAVIKSGYMIPSVWGGGGSFTNNQRFSLFQALEDYLWQSSDLLDRLEDMREDLNHNDFADDVAGAKKGLDLHTEVKKKIHKIPVESIDSMGQRLLQRLPLRLIIVII